MWSALQSVQKQTDTSFISAMMDLSVDDPENNEQFLTVRERVFCCVEYVNGKY